MAGSGEGWHGGGTGEPRGCLGRGGERGRGGGLRSKGGGGQEGEGRGA